MMARRLRRSAIWKRMLGLAAVVVLLRGAPTAPIVATLYVDQSNPNWKDKGPGSASQPFCTIGAAASNAVAGQTVIVSQGTYMEKVTVANSGTQSASIVFTSAPGATVTVTGKTNGFVISNKSWITVQGF